MSMHSFHNNRLTAFSLVTAIRTVFYPITHSPQRDTTSISTAKLARTGWRDRRDTYIPSIIYNQRSDRLTALWREGSEGQIETLLSERFIGMEVEGQRGRVDALLTTV